jgi:uncharacterized membrane protein
VTFANPLPPWLLASLVAAAAVVAWQAYRRSPITPARRRTLSALRFTTLTWVLLCLMRPVGRPAALAARDAVVPILVDTSRSMGLADAGGARRIDGARAIVERELLPALDGRFHADVLRFGERLAPSTVADLSATDRRTDLADALRAIQDRYRGRAVAGVVLVSDGGDNGTGDAAAAAASGPPLFAVGVGAARPAHDREVVSVTAADSVMSDATVDLTAEAVAYGYGTAPIELRLLENGRAVDLRRVTPAADGVPISETFHVSPNRDSATIYTVEMPASGDELVAGNNARSVLVPAAGRPRRVLFVQGAPGFEHAFLRRTWGTDRALEIDTVVHKGRDDAGAETYYVQAAPSRAAALIGGYPATRELLFSYDVVVLANLEPDLLTAPQLAMTRAFVNQRGGGLLVLGARGFQRQGLRGTPLEDVLPLELGDRNGGVLPATMEPGRDRVAVTPAGLTHPIMQLAATPDENARRWTRIPSLASMSALGGPKPGADVLAVTGGPGGVPRALVAVQRFGDGRSMIFTGEASWRWKMNLPAQDQSFDRFWRQALRWLAQPAPEPVSIALPAAAAAGDGFAVSIAARDRAYLPRPDALVDVRITAPSGRIDTVRAAPMPGAAGMFVATLRAPEPGVYRIAADARQGPAALGTSTGMLLVGGVDPEMADPRLNDETLQRVARASGGAVVAAERGIDTAALIARLLASVPTGLAGQRRDLWSTGWSFAVLAGLLAGEWIYRRASGLR